MSTTHTPGEWTLIHDMKWPDGPIIVTKPVFGVPPAAFVPPTAIAAVCDADGAGDANARLLAAAPLLLAELITVRDGTHCQATSADINGDVCGVTFTCGGCRRRAELTKIIDQATKGT